MTRRRCLECGRPSYGNRCREDHEDDLRKTALRDMEDADAMILAMREDQQMTYEDIAAKLGLSRARVWQKVRAAVLRREERLARWGAWGAVKR